MRILNGSEIAGFIKERQSRGVRMLRQSHGIVPTLAILKPAGNPVIDTYVRLKGAYAEDIGVDCRVEELTDSEMAGRIDELNQDDSVHGIIVQLPLANPVLTDEIVAHIASSKDVDGLGSREQFTSATATAIDWLLAGYNVELRNKKIVIVGNGRLVGAPLAELWRGNGLEPLVLDDTVTDLAYQLHDADIVVSAAGVPGLVTSAMLKKGTVIVDAGTTSENGVLLGDVAADARERDDLTITPVRGGVGPLTVTVLFENVIKAASAGLNS
jgi:methylenetetrahydrofolate dehydrogenase (NADP+)/methenyltetrahydrofolate cyclohydrolase